MDYNAPSGSTDPNAGYVGATASTQGSKVPPHAVEYPQREIVNAIAAAGLTPSNGDLTQLAQAIALIAAKSAGGATGTAALARGNCVLARANAGGITLSPKNGNGVVVGGAVVSLPVGGVSAGLSAVPVNGAANGTLAASTAYYVSLANLSGTPTLRFWNAAVYSHMPDTTAGNIGVEVIANGGAPITTDTLVGMVYLDASGTFKDGDGALYLLSWFNRRRKKSATVFSANRSTTITSGFAELGSEIRGNFLTWAGEVIETNFRGSNVATAGASCQTGVGIDGTTPISPPYETNTVNLSAPYGVTGFDLYDLTQSLTEGLHYATGLGQVQPYNAPTGVWYAASTNNVNGPTGGCQLIVAVNG